MKKIKHLRNLLLVSFLLTGVNSLNAQSNFLFTCNWLGTEYPVMIYMADLDGDGYGSNRYGEGGWVTCCAGNPNCQSAAPANWTLTTWENVWNHPELWVDCANLFANIHPGAAEVCNGIDDNCNNLLDEGALIRYYVDQDVDSIGDGRFHIDLSCLFPNPPAGYVRDSGDCDDNNSQVLGITRYFRDEDGDTYGNVFIDTMACSVPNGWVVNGIDCNDQLFNLEPEGVIYILDEDQDGYGKAGSGRIVNCPGDDISNYTLWVEGLTSNDCNDNNPLIYPDATEVCNTLDDDCNGIVDDGLDITTYWYDSDGDGFGGPVPLFVCADPGGSWKITGGDCNDFDPAINPDAIEVCNDIDDNCDEDYDEGFTNTHYFNDADGDGLGNPNYIKVRCYRPDQYVTNNIDCDDTPGSGAAIGPCEQLPIEVPEMVVYAKVQAGADPVSLKVAADTNGNAYVIGQYILTATFGSSSLTSSGGNDIFIAKYDSIGSLLWVTSAGSIAEDSAINITVDQAGSNVYITGICRNAAVTFLSPSASDINRTGSGSSDFFVARLEGATGNFLAAQMSGATSTGIISDKISSAIGVSYNGNAIYVTGGLSACGNGVFGSTLPDFSACGSPLIAFLASYDANCNLQQVIMPQNIDSICNNAMMTGLYVQSHTAIHNPDHVYVSGYSTGRTNIGGTTAGDSAMIDPYYAAYTPLFTTGNPAPAVLNQITQGGGKSFGLTVNDSGYVYMIHAITNGSLFSCDSLLADSLEDAYLTKFDRNAPGGCLWNRQLASKGTDIFESIDRAQGDTVYIGGYSNRSLGIGAHGYLNHGGFDGFLLSFNGDGQALSMIDIGGTGEDYVHGVATDKKGGIFVAGSLKNSTIVIDTITLSAVNETHGFLINFKVRPAIIVTSVSASSICKGLSLNFDIDFSSISRDIGNIYTAQLSDSVGNFASATTIGTLASGADSGTIHAVFPSDKNVGTGYLVRVNSSSPARIGEKYTSLLEVKPRPSLTISNTSPKCAGSLIDMTAYTEGNNFTLLWSGPNNFTETNSYAPLYNVSAIDSGTYSVVVTGANGCTNVASTLVIVNPNPSCFVSPQYHDFCILDPGQVCACPGASYLWNTGETTQCKNITDNFATYSFVTTAANGCTAQSLFYVSANGSFTLYLDADNDGFGDPDTSIETCTYINGYIDNAMDCNDGDSLVNPMATEICGNNIDDNCNGLADDTFVIYADNDGDGYGNADAPFGACEVLTGYVINNEDCDDTEELINPSGLEVPCNSKDDNCNGKVDESPLRIAVDPFNPYIYIYNSSDWSLQSISTLTMSGYTVIGATGVSVNPLNNLCYILVKVSVNSQRRLAIVNPTTGTCTLVGNLNDNFAAITFSPDGRLFAVTGDGASLPEKLYEINPTSGVKTLKKSLGHGNDGEVIVFNNQDGFIYHWSGNSQQAFEKIDTTSYVVTVIPQTGDSHGEIFGATYDDNGFFTVSDGNANVYKISTSGLCLLQDTTENYIRGFGVPPSSTTTPSQPTLSASETIICAAETTTISITNGALNGATNWKWYIGNCGTTVVGNGISIDVSPLTTTTYFARGEGGCILSPGVCSSITITTNTSATWYEDADDDTYGSLLSNILACAQPLGYVNNFSDCNDTPISGATIHPGATELCGNSIDDDCDVLTDEGCGSGVAFNLKVFIQGYYNGQGLLTPVLSNAGISNDPLECDTIIVELHDIASPTTIWESITTILHTNGMAYMQFPAYVLNNTYYIVVRNRNSIETWSKDPVLFSGNPVTFDFTTP